VKVAISLLTCDKPELVKQSSKPLIEASIAGHFHLFVIDGSTDPENEKTNWETTYPTGHMLANVRGGAGAAIVYALTMMLNHEEGYDVVGLVESDVLLHGNWLECFDLFARGKADGLEVGCVSARSYVDRVLFQRDGFAVMHNIGAGCIMLTRKAAQIVLDTFRTAWTTDNRRIFAQLSGVDIASYWAFRGNEHYLTADWHWEAALAAQGLAALALTPSPVEMIGQTMTMAEQGLTMVTELIEQRRNDSAFMLYAVQLSRIEKGARTLGVDTKFHFNPATSTWTFFPHQMAMLGGEYSGDWKLKEARAWGTFAWAAGGRAGDEKILLEGTAIEFDNPTLVVPVFGACSVLVSGGKAGGKVEVADEQSGFKATPDVPPEGETGQVLQLMVPGHLNYRNIKITALTPGICFYGVQTHEQQPYLPNVSFDHSALPSA
jgi:hypothetical protein